MIHRDESSWFIVMIQHYEAPCSPQLIPLSGGIAFVAMGMMLFFQGIFLPWSPFCHGYHGI